MKKIAILFNLLLFWAFTASADGLVGEGVVSPQRKIDAREIIKKLSLGHSIDGFEVDCKKETIIVWGKPKNLNPSDPQLSRITLVDIKKRVVDRTLVVSGGIFGVRYLQNGKFAYLEGNPEVLINLATARLSILKEDDFEKINFERCRKFSQKSYLKYSK